MTYRSMADLLAENANLQAAQQELAAMKLAFLALRVDPVTLNHRGSDLWAQFETLRPLAEACDLGAAFDRAIVSRDQSNMDALYRYAMHVDSDAARALADAAEWMGTWVGEARQASVSFRRAAGYIADAQRVVR
jgi:hypothetical protein